MTSEQTRPTTTKEREMLRFIRKHLLPGRNCLQLYWGATATVKRDNDGGIVWFTFEGVTLEDIYWHLRQEATKAARQRPRKRPTKRKPTWDPERRELRMNGTLV